MAPVEPASGGPPDPPGYWRKLAASVVAGRKVVLCGGPLAGYRLGPWRELGVERPLLLAHGRGTGPVATEAEAEIVVVAHQAGNVIEDIRGIERALADPPPAFRAALDQFDPDRSALVIGPGPVPGESLAGRPIYGARRPAWVDLEDKTKVDELLDAAGVERAPSVVVPVGEAVGAGAGLDRGDGVVWSGDTKDGFNGGAIYVRWLPPGDIAARAEAEAFFTAHCDRVRVMPFLEGIPCSIHGLVMPEAVVVIRPVEMVVLRRGSTLVYCGAASYWDPPAGDREHMREMARRIGAELRHRVDFRGAFSLDGVLAADGFRPTEVNTRIGGGLGMVARALPDLPLHLLNLAMVEDEPFDWRPADLERLLVEATDRVRAGGAWTSSRQPIEETIERPVVWDGARFRWTEGEADGTLMVGPGATGSLARLTLDATRWEVGPSVGPAACAGFALADTEWGTALGSLSPARPAR